MNTNEVLQNEVVNDVMGDIVTSNQLEPNVNSDSMLVGAALIGAFITLGVVYGNKVGKALYKKAKQLNRRNKDGSIEADFKEVNNDNEESDQKEKSKK